MMIEIDGKKYISKEYFDQDYFEAPGYKSGYDKRNLRRDSYLNKAVAVWITQTLKLNGNERMLEIGCAYGWVVECMIEQYGFDAYGQDISPFTTKNAPPNIQHRVRECENIEIAFPGKFDLVYAMETFEHIPKPLVSEYFKNIYECLSDNGIVFCTICLGHDDNRGADIDQSHQTLQPREWWNNKFEEAGFIIRKDLEADAYELGLQTPEMPKGEWLPRTYNWHVFIAQKRNELLETRIGQIYSRNSKPNLLIFGDRAAGFTFPVADFFQIDNWGNYLCNAFNCAYKHWGWITQDDLSNIDLLMGALSYGAIKFLNSIEFTGKIIGFIDGSPFMIETPNMRPEMIECLNRIDIIGNVHVHGRELYGLFCNKDKIFDCGHIFPFARFDSIWQQVPEQQERQFVILTGGYFNSRTGMPSISAYIAAEEADEVIAITGDYGLNELEASKECLPTNIRIQLAMPQEEFWTNILPQISVLLHLGNWPATGRLTADCAAAGIPGIGIHTHYQLVCFPELLIDNLYNISRIQSLLKSLHADYNFYQYLSINGRERLIASNVAELMQMMAILQKIGFDVNIIQTKEN